MTPIAMRDSWAALYRFARFARGIARPLMTTMRQIDRWLEARAEKAAARRELASMSDYELKDIGLRRWDVEEVARGGSPRWVDRAR